MQDAEARSPRRRGAGSRDEAARARGSHVFALLVCMAVCATSQGSNNRLTGAVQWVTTLNSTGVTRANAVAASGEVLVFAGATSAPSLLGRAGLGGEDALLVWFDPNGTALSAVRFGSAAADSAEGVAVAADGAAVFACGTLAGAFNGTQFGVADQSVAGPSDAFVARFAADGALAWLRLVATSATERASALALGADALFVVGRTSGNLGRAIAGGDPFDGFVAAFDLAGTQLWVAQLGSALSDSLDAVAVAAGGAALWVGGTSSGSPFGAASLGDSDGIVALLNASANGSEVLHNATLGTAAADRVEALATAPDGGVYVAGTSRGNFSGVTNRHYLAESPGPLPTSDVFVARLAAVSYGLLWGQMLGSDGEDSLQGLAVLEAARGVVLSGTAAGPIGDDTPLAIGGTDVLVAALNASGQVEWTRLLLQANEATGGKLAVRASGDVFVSGNSKVGVDVKLHVSRVLATRCCAVPATVACATNITRQPGAHCAAGGACLPGTQCSEGFRCGGAQCDAIVCCAARSSVACGQPITRDPHPFCSNVTCSTGLGCDPGFECLGGQCSAVTCCQAPETVACGTNITRHPDVTCTAPCDPGSQCLAGQRCVGGGCEQIVCCADPQTVACGANITRDPHPFCSNVTCAVTRGQGCQTGRRCNITANNATCVPIVCCAPPNSVECRTAIARDPHPFCANVSSCAAGSRCSVQDECTASGCRPIECCPAPNATQCGVQPARHPSPFCIEAQCANGTACAEGSRCRVPAAGGAVTCDTIVCCADAATVFCGRSGLISSDPFCTTCPRGQRCTANFTCNASTHQCDSLVGRTPGLYVAETVRFLVTVNPRGDDFFLARVVSQTAEVVGAALGESVAGRVELRGAGPAEGQPGLFEITLLFLPRDGGAAPPQELADTFARLLSNATSPLRSRAVFRNVSDAEAPLSSNVELEQCFDGSFREPPCPPPPPPAESKLGLVLIVGGAALGGIALIAALVFLVRWCRRRAERRALQKRQIESGKGAAETYKYDSEEDEDEDEDEVVVGGAAAAAAAAGGKGKGKGKGKTKGKPKSDRKKEEEEEKEEKEEGGEQAESKDAHAAGEKPAKASKAAAAAPAAAVAAKVPPPVKSPSQVELLEARRGGSEGAATAGGEEDDDGVEVTGAAPVARAFSKKNLAPLPRGKSSARVAGEQ
jgi:hypothetical protein